MYLEATTGKILFQAHINFNLVLKTDLAKQLFGLTLRMANTMTALSPQEAFSEIITGLEQNLEEEKKVVESLPVKAVTNFPVTFKKQVSLCHPKTMRFLNLLTALDKVAQRWYDLYFTGKMSPEEFEQKKQGWRGRFRNASLKVNAMKRQNGKNGANGREGKGAS